MNGANLYYTDGRLIGCLNGRDRICSANGSALFTVSQQILTSLKTGIRYTILADGRVVDPNGVQFAYYQVQAAQQAVSQQQAKAPSQAAQQVVPQQQAKAASQTPGKRPAEKPSTMTFFLYTVASLIVIYLLPPSAQYIGLFAAVGIWYLYKHSLKSAAQQYDVENVNWNGIGQQLLDLSRILPQISYLPLMAKGDFTRAELYGDSFMWYKSAYNWILSAYLSVDNEAYTRRHGKDPEVRSSGDYISIQYPYPKDQSGLLEQIDYSCSVTLYVGGSGSLDFNLSIPASVPVSVIRDRLNAVSPALAEVTRSLPRRDKDVLTIT